MLIDAGGQPDSGGDAGFDAGADAGPDSGVDSGITDMDAGLDGGVPDAGPDGGPIVDAGEDGGTESIPFVVECTPEITWSLEVADFNQDGIDDLVKSGAYTVICFGTPDGGLVPGPTLPVSYLVSVADVNGDGWPDLVVTSNSSIDIELNLHDGSFSDTSIPTVLSYQTLAADFDHDGWLDLVTCTNSGVFIYLDDGGAPNYGSPIRLSAPNGSGVESCNNISIGDLNGDGIPDIVSYEDSQNLFVRLSQLDSGFSAEATPTSCNPNVSGRLVIADLNGDGLLDVICGANPTGIALRFNLGGGVLGDEIVIASDPPSGFEMMEVVVADLNGDGAPDIGAVGSRSDDCPGGSNGYSLFYFLNDGGGGFGAGQILPGERPDSFHGIVAWRPAGATFPDLAVGDWCDGNISIFPAIGVDAGT
jgi:hypothetical protein